MGIENRDLRRGLPEAYLIDIDDMGGVPISVATAENPLGKGPEMNNSGVVETRIGEEYIDNLRRLLQFFRAIRFR